MSEEHRMTTLHEMFAGLAARTPEPLPLPEAQKMELAALAERYARECAFRAGDWVTPVASCNIIGHGQPHLVLRTQERVHDFSKGSPGSSEYGTPINMLVACYDRNGCTSTYWTDSCWFEPYVAPTS